MTFSGCKSYQPSLSVFQSFNTLQRNALASPVNIKAVKTDPSTMVLSHHHSAPADSSSDTTTSVSDESFICPMDQKFASRKPQKQKAIVVFAQPQIGFAYINDTINKQ
jgi:hypothetical protein